MQLIKHKRDKRGILYVNTAGNNEMCEAYFD